MDRIKASIVIGTLLVLTAVPLTALAASDAQTCEASGGVYQNVNGTKSCTFSDPPGNNQGGVVKTEEDSQKGSFSSSHPQTTEDCVNNNGGSHC